MAETSLNVGIIGAGRIGKVHAATLAYRIPTRQHPGGCGRESRRPRSKLAAQFGIPVADGRLP